MAVKVESFQNRLRLRWSYQGERYTLSLGLDDTQVGRTIAQGRVSQIETDLMTGNFDRTRAKYKTGAKPPKLGSKVTAVDLFDRFTQYNTQGLDPRTVEKYRAVRVKVLRLLGDECAAIDESRAERFRLDLAKSIAAKSQKEYLAMLSSCWQWGIKEGLVLVNPWGEVVRRIKVYRMQNRGSDRPAMGSSIRRLQLPTVTTALERSVWFRDFSRWDRQPVVTGETATASTCG